MEFNKYLERVFCDEEKRNQFEKIFSEKYFNSKKVELVYNKEFFTEFALFVDNEKFCELTNFETGVFDEKLCVFYNCLMAGLIGDNYKNESRFHFIETMSRIAELKEENEYFNDVEGIESNNNDLLYFNSVYGSCNENNYGLGRYLRSLKQAEKEKANHAEDQHVEISNNNTSKKNPEEL